MAAMTIKELWLLMREYVESGEEAEYLEEKLSDKSIKMSAKERKESELHLAGLRAKVEVLGKKKIR